VREVRANLPRCKREDRQKREPRHFRRRQNRVRSGAGSHADIVDTAQQEQRRNGDELTRGKRPRAETERHGQQHVRMRERRHEIAEIVCETNRHCRAASAQDDEQHRPAVEESDERSERFLQKHIHTAGLRIERAHLGIRQRAREREQATRSPGDQNQRRRRQRGRHAARGEKDSGPDDAADDEQRGSGRADRAFECRLGHQGARL
jgi:hypothetical protein